MPNRYWNDNERATIAVENFIPVRIISRLINSIYYREFSDEIAAETLNAFNAIDVSSVNQIDLPAALEICSVPYMCLSQLHMYRELDVRDGGSYTTDQEIRRIEHLAALISKILTQKFLHQDSARIGWSNPNLE